MEAQAESKQPAAKSAWNYAHDVAYDFLKEIGFGDLSRGRLSSQDIQNQLVQYYCREKGTESLTPEEQKSIGYFSWVMHELYLNDRGQGYSYIYELSYNELYFIPENSFLYGKARYILGLKEADARHHYAAFWHFLAAFSSLQEEGLKQLAENLCLQMIEEEFKQWGDLLTIHVMYIMAALHGSEGAKKILAEQGVCTFRDSSQFPQFSEGLPAYQRYQVIHRLRILEGRFHNGYYKNEKYLAALNENYLLALGELRRELTNGSLQCAPAEKGKLLAKIECQELLYNEALHNEEKTKDFVVGPNSKKFVKLKERALGGSRLSEYWKPIGRSIRDNGWMAALIVPIPFMLLYYGVHAAVFPFWAAFVEFPRQAKLAWVNAKNKDGGHDDRAPEEKKLINENIRKEFNGVQSKSETRLREKISNGKLNKHYSLEFFPRMRKPDVAQGLQATSGRAFPAPGRS